MSRELRPAKRPPAGPVVVVVFLSLSSLNAVLCSVPQSRSLRAAFGGGGDLMFKRDEGKVCIKGTHEQVISRRYLAHISAASRRHLGDISAISRRHLDVVYRPRV